MYTRGLCNRSSTDNTIKFRRIANLSTGSCFRARLHWLSSIFGEKSSGALLSSWAASVKFDLQQESQISNSLERVTETNMDVDFLGVVIEPCNKKEISCPENTIYHLTSVALDEPYGLKDSNVKVFVEVNDEKFAIGTLSSEMHPHIRVDFCFKKNFQLFHTSLISKVAVCGYQVKNLGKFTDSEGDESDEEVPPGIQLYPKSDDIIKESQHKTSKLSALKSAVVASPMQEAFIEETKKSKADDDDNSKQYSDSSGESSDDEDSSSDDGGSCDEEETPSKNTKDKNEQVVTPLKTPPKKTTKLETPILDSKAGTTTGKRSGYVQVANPHPAKQAKKTPANNDTPKRSAGYVCSSCNKPFNSSMGLKDHSKAKHPATN